MKESGLEILESHITNKSLEDRLISYISNYTQYVSMDVDEKVLSNIERIFKFKLDKELQDGTFVLKDEHGNYFTLRLY
jgi:hypothetical protein